MYVCIYDRINKKSSWNIVHSLVSCCVHVMQVVETLYESHPPNGFRNVAVVVGVFYFSYTTHRDVHLFDWNACLDVIGEHDILMKKLWVSILKFEWPKNMQYETKNVFFFENRSSRECWWNYLWTRKEIGRFYVTFDVQDVLTK